MVDERKHENEMLLYPIQSMVASCAEVVESIASKQLELMSDWAKYNADCTQALLAQDLESVARLQAGYLNKLQKDVTHNAEAMFNVENVDVLNTLKPNADKKEEIQAVEKPVSKAVKKRAVKRKAKKVAVTEQEPG